MSVDSDNNALNTLANLGLLNPGGVAALPGAAGIQQQASSLGNIVANPLDFTQQQSIMNQGDVASAGLDALSQNLGVQKAVAAEANDKASRQGKATTDERANRAQSDIATVGQTGLQEQAALQNAALTNRSAMALGKLHMTAQQIAQQGLQSKAALADQATTRGIQLAESGGAQAVQQAATSAHNNSIAIMQQYNAQQWSFWTKLATGLLSAAGAVGGALLGGPLGAVAGGAAGNAVAGATMGSGDTSAPVLNGYQAYNPQLGNTTSLGTDPTPAPLATANASYTPVPDGLPIT